MGSFAHRMKYPLPKEVKKNRLSCRPSLRDLGGKCHLGRDLTLIEGVISPIFSPGNRVSESDVAIPYHCSKKEKSIWLDRGLTIRRQTGMPWMVLHHVPPKRGPGVSGEESEAADLLSTYRPDYFVSGHDHSFPYVVGQSWRQNVGEACLLVPGQLLPAPYPNYINLNTITGESSWHTDRETGMSEDEQLDHLLLKFLLPRKG
jgi:hypothetical protein